MPNIPLGTTTYVRAASEEPSLSLENRFFESNPTNQEDQTALLLRPGFKKWLTVSANPIDNIYYQPGSFADSIFVASGGSLYRVDKNESVNTVATNIFNTSFGSSGRVTIRMAATSSIGSTPEYLWITDGVRLWMYTNSNLAQGLLTSTGTIANGDKIQIGGVYYQWTTGSVDAGTPAGTSANPWLVPRGASSIVSLTAMKKAINKTGTAGIDYSTALTIHPTVYADNNPSIATMSVYCKSAGTVGNSISTTLITGSLLTWGAATLTTGGTATVVQVLVPDYVGVLDVAFISGYIIVVSGEGYGVNGRFYWIRPGEIYIDPFSFATAERAPDPLYNVQTIGDQFWLFGPNTTEVWYPTGDSVTPFIRSQGRLFDHGVWQGSIVKIKDRTMVVDTDGIVYSIEGNPTRVSNNGIEERIRKSFADQRINGTVMRVWGFSLDGHDFFLIRLVTAATLVYDLTTDTWSEWKSAGLSYLNQHVGMNWVAAGSTTYSRGQLTNVVAGDSRSGVLWLADSTYGADQNITTAVIEPFTAKVMGGIQVTARQMIPCNGVYLKASLGVPKTTGATVTLRTSDDLGQTWISHGAITITSANYLQELSWRSIGRIDTLGRIFEITDNGAVMRINSLEMV